MALRAQIVAEALEWQGTPYHHRAARKGVGCDCIGLVIGVARAVGCLAADWHCPRYSAQWHWHRSEEVLVETVEAVGCQPLALAQVQAGDIVVLQYGRVCSHTAIVVGEGLVVHATRDNGRVLRQRWCGELRERTRWAYSLPGVESVG